METLLHIIMGGLAGHGICTIMEYFFNPKWYVMYPSGDCTYPITFRVAKRLHRVHGGHICKIV